MNNSNNSHIYELNKLSKYYDDELVWENLSIKIIPGEIVGLIGANGSGKTTLFKTILGLVKPTSGEIITNLSLDDDVGFLLEISLFNYLTAEENIEIIGLYNQCHYTPSEIETVLIQVGLLDVSNKKVSKFSFGMKQRLRLAVAIIRPRKLLILDEPLLGLDPEGINDFLNLTKELSSKNKTSIIISTHQLSEISKVFDYYYYIKNKQLYLGAKESNEYIIKIHPEEKIHLLLQPFNEISIQNSLIIVKDIKLFISIITLLNKEKIKIIDIDKKNNIQSEVFSL